MTAEISARTPIPTLHGVGPRCGIRVRKTTMASGDAQRVWFPEMIEDLSPIRKLDRWHVPVVVAYGSLETPEFQRQARDFVDALARAGKEVKLVVGEGYNHFEMRETLGNPYGLLGRAALQQMRRGE